MWLIKSVAPEFRPPRACCARDASMTIDLDLAAIENFAIPILIGALVGIEREKWRDTETNIGGIRTFAARLLASLGGMPGERQPVGNLTPMN